MDCCGASHEGRDRADGHSLLLLCLCILPSALPSGLFAAKSTLRSQSVETSSKSHCESSRPGGGAMT